MWAFLIGTLWHLIHTSWLILFLPPFDPWPLFYWSPPLHGQVVDAETKEPLPNVIVVAKWMLQATPSANAVDELEVMETVTDGEGRFAFTWRRPRFRWPWRGYLYDHAPEVIMFKSGYRFATFWRDRTDAQAELLSWMIRAVASPREWTSPPIKRVELSVFKGKLQEYAEHLADLEDGYLDNVFTVRNCSWRNYPRMQAVLHVEAERFRSLGISHRPHTLEERERSFEKFRKRCGSVVDLAKEYIPRERSR